MTAFSEAYFPQEPDHLPNMLGILNKYKINAEKNYALDVDLRD